jgi:uncharacterized membrane protein
VTWYDFLKFMHVNSAVIWVGGAAMFQFFALRAMAAGTGERLVAVAKDIEWIGVRVLIPSSAAAFLFGLGLVWNASFWGFGDDWIVIGLVLFALTFLAGVLFFGPEAGRVSKLIDAEGHESAAVAARTKRLIVLTRIDLVILFLLIFDMSVKPSFSDGWTIVGALVAGAALSALLVLPAGRTVLEPPAAAGDQSA